jgi:hypothetical protein
MNQRGGLRAGGGAADFGVVRSPVARGAAGRSEFRGDSHVQRYASSETGGSNSGFTLKKQVRTQQPPTAPPRGRACEE